MGAVLGNSQHFTVGSIARTTIGVVADSWPYFLLLVFVRWVATEPLQLLSGNQHLFIAAASNTHGTSWIAQAADQLTVFVSLPISAAIAMRTHVIFLKSKKSWRQEWLAVVRSLPALIIYAMILAAIGLPFYLMILVLPFVGTAISSMTIAAVLLILAVVMVALLLVLLAWAIVVPIIVIEQKRAFAALKMSNLLTRYRRGTVFLAIALLGVCELIVRSAAALATNQSVLSHPVPALLSGAGILDAVIAMAGTALASVGATIIYEQFSSVGPYLPTTSVTKSASD